MKTTQQLPPDALIQEYCPLTTSTGHLRTIRMGLEARVTLDDSLLYKITPNDSGKAPMTAFENTKNHLKVKGNSCCRRH